MTDHRVKLTRGNIEGVLDGELDEMTAALEAEEKRRKLAAAALVAGERADAAAARSTVRSALREAEARLTAVGSDPPARRRAAAGGRARRRPRGALRAREAPLAPDAAAAFAHHLGRRAASEPVAYILGRRAFRRLEIAVDPRVLIPRPETELLVEVALRALPGGGRVHDVGTGSGAIALALKDERPDLMVSGSDSSAPAIAVARANAARLGLEVDLSAGPGFRR